MKTPFEVERDDAPQAKIKVIGVGGAGANAVDSMIKSGLDSVDYYVVNTDAQALNRSSCPNRIQIGIEVTGGLGSGGDPMVGEKSAEAERDQLREAIEGADMIFLTAGLGGGTGTGATPVIAQIAKELGALTVAIMTKPFRFEGPQRMSKSMQGIERLREYVDTLIMISNDRLLELVDRSATLLESFAIANSILTQGVESISELISEPGMINVDFADVRTIMGETGGAVMGVGVGRGEQRAVEAVNKACSSPLLEKIVIDGARGVLICIAGGTDLTLHEVNESTTMVFEKADPEANIIFGAVVDEKLQDEVRVTIIATGFDDDHATPSSTPREVKKSDQALKSPTSPISLKAKLESMMGPEGKQKSSSLSAKEEQTSEEETKPNVAKAADSDDDSASGKKVEVEVERKKKGSAKDKKAKGDDKVDDTDFDTPTYLRKKDLLE